jgi:hypothetical protein
MNINELWNCTNNDEWNNALERYWTYVKPVNEANERELNELNPHEIAIMNANEFYDFLRNKYFVIKYTAPNRYATTTRHLSKYLTEGKLQELYLIKEDLFHFDKTDIKKGLEITTKIKGLGASGASGLLSILFPRYFGTIDQFVVKAFRGIDDLPEIALLNTMNPDSLSIKNGTVLIEIMRRKAIENNLAFQVDYWTPRKLDMILWTYGR